MISTTKLTGRSLVAAFRKYAQHRAKAKANKAVDSDHGKMSVEKLIRKDQGRSRSTLPRAASGILSAP